MSPAAEPLPERLEPQELVAGRYQLTRRIARGGVGEVYAACDRSTGKLVALKRLHEAGLAHRGVLATFMREYHALSELRHPRIIEVYDYGVDRDIPYYTMELLDGQDLRELSPLPYQEACLHLRDVASSLALLHARRLLHRDVSLRNVRRTSDGRCKLIDFGAMIPFGVPPNVTGTVPGIPPEALQGASLDQRSDLYALGALAYCLLVGRHAHDVNTLQELPGAWRKPVRRPKQRVRDLPDALDELVMALLSLDPMQRPKSAAEVIDWLSAAAQLPPDDSGAVARSFMTSSRLCGRARESAVLTKRLSRAAEGSGCTVMVEGSTGSGKSRLLSEAALLAQTCGLVVVRAVARAQRGANELLASDLVSGLAQVAPLEAENAGAARIDWSEQKPVLGPVRAEGGSEPRAALQHAVHELFCSVARARPLLLIVDDVDQADELSIALLGGLAHQARNLPLMLVCSRSLDRAGMDFDASLALRSVATSIQLGDLRPADCALLVESIFGKVPNIARLTDWMYRTGRGNPQLTLELAEHLCERQLVRYVEGAWVLPPVDIDESMPSDLAGTFMLRMQGLSDPARSLAELLSVRRGGASTELCLSAGAALTADVLTALDELVRRGILESAGNGYAFATAALRHSLQESLPNGRQKELHSRWADVLLSRAANDNDGATQLEAGWHLVHGTDPVRGADLLAHVAPPFVEQGLAMDTAIPAIERALSVYEQHARPLEARLRLRSALVLAGYLFDYRLAARYGSETLSALHRVSGMELAARLGALVGGFVGLSLALAITGLRRLVTPRSRRGPPPYTALIFFVRSAMGLLGVSALQMDAQGVARIVRMLKPFGSAPRFTSGPMVYLAARAFATQGAGQEGEFREQLHAALAETRRGRRFDMTPHEYQHLLVSLLLADGVQECMRESSQALARADELAAIGGRFAEAVAERVRMLYHLKHGDFDRAEKHRRQIDINAVQGGTTWQVEWFSLPMEAMCGVIWSDLLMVRRAMDRLENLALELPGLTPHALSARIGYHFKRGEFARAVEYGERYVAAAEPRCLIGWGWTYALHAFSLLELGRYTQALAITERAVAALTDDDRAYYLMYGPLELAHAAALALTGQRAKADLLVRTRTDRLRELGEHAELAGMYQYVVRMAHLLDDRAELERSLAAMREAALQSGLSTVALLADRIAAAHARPHSSAPPANPTLAERELADQTVTTHHSSAREETVAGVLLQRHTSGAARNREALRVLARWIASDEAFLYVPDASQPKLLAALGNEEAPDELLAAIEQLLQSPASAERPVQVVELSSSTPVSTTAASERLRRYRIVPLSSGHAAPCVAAVVLRDHGDANIELPNTLIEDVGRLVARQLRNDAARAQSERS